MKNTLSGIGMTNSKKGKQLRKKSINGYWTTCGTIMINLFEIKISVNYLYRFLILKLVPALLDREPVYQYLNMTRRAMVFLFNLRIV
jgi:hypothetical protein